jgi:hypothetical protein
MENDILPADDSDKQLEQEIAEVEAEAKTEATPAPEPAAEAKSEAPAPEPKVVPIQALDEARHRTRELNERLQQEAEKRARMEARFEEVMKRLAQPEQPPAPVPQYEADPLGNHNARLQATEAQLAEFRRVQEAQSKQTEQQRAFMDTHSRVKSLEADFAKTNSDYFQAYEFARNARDQELQVLGFADPAIRNQIISENEMGIVQLALQQGANPAERIYAYAKARGFAPQQSDGQAKLNTLQRGQAAAKSLSQASGSPPPPQTLEALADLEGKDFDAAFEKMLATGRKKTTLPF